MQHGKLLACWIFSEEHCLDAAKKTAYLSLVRPHLEHCASVWSPHLLKDKDLLECIQKGTKHWICSKWDPHTYSWSKSYKQELQELRWQSIGQRHEFLLLCQVYKTVNTPDCIRLNDYLPSPQGLHIMAMHWHLNVVNAVWYSFSPFIWSKLPSHVSCSPSLPTFKCHLYTTCIVVNNYTAFFYSVVLYSTLPFLMWLTLFVCLGEWLL